MVKWLNNDNLNKLMKTLNPCMAVGGCVRNHIMKKTFNDEVDLATSLLPEEVMKLAKDAGFQVIPTGLQHGTVTCIMDKDVFEVTTLRVDIETDGRHAKVEFSKSWEEDAKRRDLTINALYSDLDGKIYDYTSGLEDIKRGMIRFIGDPDQRIQEDYLRILRFFRFLAHYGQEHDVKSLESCGKYVSNLTGIARERCIVEMIKLLHADNFLFTLKLMDKINLWNYCDFPSPDFEVIDRIISQEKILNLKSSALCKFASFKGSVDDVKLSNLQKRNVQLLRDLPNMNCKKDYVKWINNAPRDLWDDGFILKGRLSDLSFLDIWKENLFYFSGQDIMKIADIAPGPKVKHYLDQLMNWFIGQDLPPNYQDLCVKLQGIK
ncbi:CCA tRNA nucleotidyltransferase [Candidatus Cytomitobacter indipagum]|uniref:CCA tRNA nucleotidyltransferase n=1 Tax=Candidatus Cytomitobacter indipagum TaxID=2601575 RepID=A0A5C0UEW3_9PROT|nr:CCA tRNA nucleotidyltransferase [Candidatus Cytomitobacter indipagum]QEK38257.1 CCA tRNA nucleotidyltransferase [Candidatus Cytomitobacter indipagum]